MIAAPAITAAEYTASWDPSEAVFQRTVEDTARALGWNLIYHTLNSRGSAAGFPDLILTREGVLIAWEIKTRRGRIRPEQLAWISALQQVPGVIAGIMRPQDYDRMVVVLETGTLPAAGEGAA